MIAIDNILISEDIIDSYFRCNLESCQGACCYEEMLLKKNGVTKYYKDLEGMGTQLINGGPCVFLIKDELGISKCGIEQAYYQGLTKFKKPISCHLYPIRITENPKQGFIAVNYDRWEICDPACKAGKKEKVPLYKFLQESITRRFGEAFYEELASAADHKKSISGS